MSEQTIAMIFAGFGVVGALVTWAFYFVVGKSLWDMRRLFRGTPGDQGRGRLGQRDAHEQRPEERH